MYRKATIYYPQSEIHTPLIPVTTGCPHNVCTFCMMFKDQPYTELPISDIEYELKNIDPYAERVFLVGADPLCVGYDKMKLILEKVKKYAPYCACVAAYASIRSISKYSVEELSTLHNMGLRMLYVGFESGWDYPLKLMNKGHTVQQAIEQGKKMNQARILFNAIVMYGIAGKGNGEENAKRTAEMLNQFHSHKIVTMNLSIFDTTPLARMVDKGQFAISGAKDRLVEIKTLLEHLNVEKETIFDTTHTTNIIKLEGTLPQDKEKLISQIKV